MAEKKIVGEWLLDGEKVSLLEVLRQARSSKAENIILRMDPGDWIQIHLPKCELSGKILSRRGEEDSD